MTVAHRAGAAGRITLLLAAAGSARIRRPRLKMGLTRDMSNKGVINNGRLGPRSQTGGSRRRRAGALAAVLAGTALLAAACSASSTQTDAFAPGATYAQTLAFAKCMRANGVPQFPNPDRQGNFSNATIQALENNGSQDRNALFQCRSVLPNAGTGLTIAQIQQIQEQNLRDAIKGAECMRAHGITNFADPTASNQASGVNWQPDIAANVNTSTPSYEAALSACNSGKVAGGIIPPSFGLEVLPSGSPSGTPTPPSGNG